MKEIPICRSRCAYKKYVLTLPLQHALSTSMIYVTFWDLEVRSFRANEMKNTLNSSYCLDRGNATITLKS